MPGGINVSIKILLWRLASANAVAWVIVREYIAVDARAQANVEAAHLTKIDRVAVWKQHGEPEGQKERN